MKTDNEFRLAQSMMNHGPLQANLWVIKDDQANNYQDFVMLERMLYDVQKSSLPPVFLTPPIPVPTLPAGCEPDVQAAADAL